MTAIRSIPQSAIDLVKHFEGFSSKPYVCPAGFLTIGYGHVVPNDYPKAARVTPEEAEELLRKDLRVAALGVLRLTKVPLSDNQYGALVSFVFNLGSIEVTIVKLLKSSLSGSMGAVGSCQGW
jgi:lysozyme